MSIMNCNNCNHNVDTDFHETCTSCDECLCGKPEFPCEDCKIEEIPQFKGTLEQLDKIKIK